MSSKNVKKKSTYIKKSNIQIKVGNYIEYRKEPNMNPKEYKTNCSLKYAPDIFHNLSIAKSALKHYVKMHIIMLGEVGDYLVVCGSDAERLYRLGYEYAV